MFIKPFGILFKDQVNPSTMSYLGCVEDNNDPKKLGRIRVRVAPFGDLATEELPWASPTLGAHGNSAEYGGLNVPEIGSQVRVTFPSRDFTAPYYSGAELNDVNRTTFFDEDYPHTYGYKDSIGNFAKINKERGTIQFQHTSTTNMQVSVDGSIKVSLNGGAYFIFDSGKNFDLNIGTLDVSGSADGTLAVEANNEVNIKAPQVNINGNIDISGNVNIKEGWSGTFMALGNFVSVKNGIITSVE